MTVTKKEGILFKHYCGPKTLSKEDLKDSHLASEDEDDRGDSLR